MSTCTVVVPAYDEEERLDEHAFAAFVRRDPSARLLLVDDGSRDRTLEALERVRASAPASVDVLALPRNVGKAEAVRRGVLAALARGPDHVAYLDADLSTPFDALGDLRAVLDARPDALAVYGARVALLGRPIERLALRHVAGRVFATAAAFTLGLAVYDTQCGAKAFRATPAVRRLFEEPFVSRWAFDVEILARMIRDRRRGLLPPVESVLVEHPLREWRHRAGSKVRPRDFLLALRDLVRIRRLYLTEAAARPLS
jgi:glycosyltransferase involved in cell wall biosynthesis